ncbi:septal ring lytic transglycosylase RlpA family protein [Methylotenera sp. 1P/1]|uniref:septal ring lytic transglycosylase RlpA family protein n=1 Tax=Methylotenera sp. 1P/1 TaxID=1131551 RepID=UPI00036B1AAC|nr:septal ring lytic transglycosylase RlpA family protein [Methylotenera sp. 1P/1]
MNHFFYIVVVTLLLSACGGQQTTRPAPPSPPAEQPDNSTGQPPTKAPSTPPAEVDTPGGYYMDDGPEANPPSNLDDIPDATPKEEPINPAAMRPYQALGETYVPMKSYAPFKQAGIASWYGKRFHGRKTSNGETYNMYAMTAAHPTLPLPSYVKVTNPKNGRTVIVRVNDRGPFKHSRIIDLSYAAAYKLRILDRGSAHVEIEAVNAASYAAQNKNATPVPKPVETTANPANSSSETVQNITTPFFVQVGAFKLEANANALRQKIQNLGIASSKDINHVYNSQLYRLKLGPYPSRSKASQIAADIKQRLNINSIIHTQ